MAHADTTDGGIPGLGAVPWGSHCCNFYEDRDDLVETLVPYFKAGLESNDACLWVTSEPFRAADARSALAAVVPDLAARERRGQIEIVEHEEWYLRQRGLDGKGALDGWLQREERALAAGYQGLRLTGNTYWLEREDWKSFVEYERLVNETFRTHRIVALCSYCAARCSANDVLDVVAHHRSTISRREGVWQVIESAALKLAHQDLLRVQEAADALRENARHKDEFIAMLGHELRNPLAPIATAVQLMRLRGATGFERELDVMERQVRHLGTLVGDLLDVARITRGRVLLDRRPLEVAEPVGRAVEMCEPLLRERGHALSLDVPLQDLQVDGDLDRLSQVVANLLANAARYTPDGGRIEIRAEPHGANAVSIRVSDDGPGLPDGLAPHAFELFVQGHRTFDRREGGLGLGLPIVKSLVELHGGTVRLETPSGGGTAVTVALPRARVPRRPAGAPSHRVRSRRMSSRRVLIVDDNTDAARLMRSVLERAGHVVAIAFDARSALALAESFRPQRALLDLGLPDLDGYALAGRLAGDDLKLIALTGYGSDDDRARTRDAGFAAHLVKPVALDTLLDAID